MREKQGKDKRKIERKEGTWIRLSCMIAHLGNHRRLSMAPLQKAMGDFFITDT